MAANQDQLPFGKFPGDPAERIRQKSLSFSQANGADADDGFCPAAGGNRDHWAANSRMVNLAKFAPQRPIPTLQRAIIMLGDGDFRFQISENVKLVEPSWKKEGPSEHPALRTAITVQNRKS